MPSHKVCANFVQSAASALPILLNTFSHTQEQTTSMEFSWLLTLLLCCIGITAVDSETHLRRTSQVGQEAEAQLHDQEEIQSLLYTSRELEDAQSLALVASMYLHLDIKNNKQRKQADRCLEKRSNKILRLLNKGFEEVIGRVAFIQGSMEIDSHACGSQQRRLVVDGKWDGIGDDRKEEEEQQQQQQQRHRGSVSREGGHSTFRYGLDSTRDLQLTKLDYNVLFRGGAKCRFCYPEDYDLAGEGSRKNALKENLRILTIMLNAHLTSVMQLSGIPCIERKSPRVTVTLVPTSIAEAERADCEANGA